MHRAVEMWYVVWLCAEINAANLATDGRTKCVRCERVQPRIGYVCICIYIYIDIIIKLCVALWLHRPWQKTANKFWWNFSTCCFCPSISYLCVRVCFLSAHIYTKWIYIFQSHYDQICVCGRNKLNKIIFFFQGKKRKKNVRSYL